MSMLDWFQRGTQEMMVARPDGTKAQVVWKHPDPTIPMKSQLTVDADEKAIFFRDGQVVSVLDPGRHTLDSDNLPFLSNLVDSFTGGNVFVAEVFFVNVREHVGIKFGGRIGHVEDPKSGVPVETMVHGEFSFKVTDPEKLKKLAKHVPDVKKEFTRSEALRTRAFWVFAIALSWHGLFTTAVVFHLTAIGAEHGLTRDQAYAIFLPIPLISVSTNFIAGWLSNRFRMRFHLCVMMASQFMFTIALHFFGTFEAQLFLIVGLGISGGLFNVILSVAIPRFFGRLHLGGISGIIASIMVFASALGPVYFGTIQALTGTFNHALTLGLPMPILLILAALRTENPQELLD